MKEWSGYLALAQMVQKVGLKLIVSLWFLYLARFYNLSVSIQNLALLILLSPFMCMGGILTIFFRQFSYFLLPIFLSGIYILVVTPANALCLMIFNRLFFCIFLYVNAIYLFIHFFISGYVGKSK